MPTTRRRRPAAKRPSKNGRTSARTRSYQSRRRRYSNLISSSSLVPSYATTGIGLPKSKLVTLHYTDHKNMQLGDNWTFKINSAYDPDAAVGGHQPKGYDQWMSLYNKYTVVGAKYKFTFTWDSAAMATTPGEFITILNRDSVPTGGWSNYIETNGGTGTTVLPADLTAVRTVQGTFSTKKFFNLSEIRDNHSIQGTITGDPAWIAYLIFYTRDFTGGVSANEFTAKVDISMSVLLSEPAELSGS